MKNLWAGVAFLGLLAVPHGVAAQGLSLASRPSELADLRIGQIIEVDVVTNGLSGEELTSLGGSVSFDQGLRANGVMDTVGIVPDVSDLTSTVVPGLVDGIFFHNDSPRGITDNGVFYTFSLEVVDLSTGSIRFQPGSLFSSVAGENNPRPLTPGAALNFTVVPEPSVLAISLLGMIAATRRCLRPVLRDHG